MSAGPAMPVDRRSFLKLSALAGGGLALGYFFRPDGPARGEVASPAANTGFRPSAFLRIGVDGTVTIQSARPEMGQGVKTSLPMIVAEELGADWRRVAVVSAPLDPVYGGQAAGGSRSTPDSYGILRRIGATARVLLVRAAAQAWGVSPAECAAEDGAVRHRPSDRTLRFGALAEAAARLPVPPEAEVELRDPRTFTLLGSRIGGVDNPKVVTGQPLFGIDQRLPGMLYAVYEKCPVWGGSAESANLAPIKALPGVRDAFVISETAGGLTGLLPGVAIVADSTWAALSARRQLRVAWKEGNFADSSWAGFAGSARALAAGERLKQVRRDGDVDGAFGAAAKSIEAEYSYAFISHASLEPQNCTAHVRADRAEFWAPTQNPAGGRAAIASLLRIPPENIAVNITRIGGGFGRRLHSDFMLEAAAISRRAGAPIKLTWTREDDMRHDHFRPGGFHFLKGALDANGRLAAWSSRQVYFDNSLGPKDFPASFVPNYLLRTAKLDNGVPMGPWRAPGSCTYAFVACSFLDELARAAGRDPLEFNLEVLAARGAAEAPFDAARMAGVLALAAEKSGWGARLPRGRGMGIAYHYCHLGYAAEVAEVTVSPAGDLKVDRVVAAVDVGSQIMNLSGAENQVQGAVIDGLSAAWQQELNIERGRAVEGNFDQYALLRIPDAPRRIDVHFLKTDHPPTGLGEPCLPPLAPAVANAVFAATSIRIRQLPFSRTDLRWS